MSKKANSQHLSSHYWQKSPSAAWAMHWFCKKKWTEKFKHQLSWIKRKTPIIPALVHQARLKRREHFSSHGSRERWQRRCSQLLPLPPSQRLSSTSSRSSSSSSSSSSSRHHHLTRLCHFLNHHHHKVSTITANKFDWKQPMQQSIHH